MKANFSLNESLIPNRKETNLPKLLREHYPDDTANGMCKNG